MSWFMINISGGRMLQSYIVFPIWDDFLTNFASMLRVYGCNIRYNLYNYTLMYRFPAGLLLAG